MQLPVSNLPLQLGNALLRSFEFPGQLRGEPFSGSTCAPALERVNATTGEKTTINPCGLMAWSYFNDTYAVAVDGEVVVAGLRARVGPESEVHFLPALAGG